MIRKLTPEQIADQLRGSTRLAPGIWIDREGCYHFSIVELLEMVDLEQTPDNIAAVEAIIYDHLARVAPPGATIIRQESE